VAVTLPTTLPYAWYADPSVLRLEQERIFARSWQYAARADQVAAPGQFAAVTVGHLPVVLVRGRDGELRGFVNVCRHRGSVLCEGEGRRETIQCPYHAWTYDLDGSLRTAPRSDREPGFAAGELGLLPVSVATWGPFVFANPDPDAPPLDETLGDLPGLLRDGGIDVDALEFRVRADAPRYEANWKVIVENFLECYHCAVAHPTLAKALDVGVDAYTLETRPTFSSQLSAAHDGGGGVYDASGEVERSQFHFLFPSTVINVMPGRPNMSIGPVLAEGPEQTTRFLDYFFAPGTGQEWIDDYLALDELVGAEDRLLVERVQTGVRAGAVGEGRLLAESEQLIAHFQALVVDALGADETGDR
jgi:phenylpropionate dioxygenase-like ring-hydroxylating dioxygenase large terminal subunit